MQCIGQMAVLITSLLSETALSKIPLVLTGMSLDVGIKVNTGLLGLAVKTDLPLWFKTPDNNPLPAYRLVFLTVSFK